MEPATFFDKFEQFADAPNAMVKMREMIVQFAVQGKLVPNNAVESPVFLKMTEVASNKMPIHTNWRRGILGDVIQLEYGDNLPAPKRTQTGEYPVYGSNGIVGTHDTYLIKEPAIIVGRKGSAGALNIAAGPSWTTDVAYFVRPPSDLDLRFTYYLLSSLHLDVLGKGIKPGLSRKDAYELPIALPPLAEQKRIVEKVDELMALCDRLEAQQQERDTRHAALARAALARFADAPTPANLNLLFHPAYTISPTDIRKTILTLAVQGKLVPQDANDEPAENLLAEIAKRIGKSKKSRITGDADFAPEAKRPFALPPGWAWSRFPALGEFGRGKSKHRPRNDHSLFAGGHYRLVQTGDVARANGTIKTHTGLYNDVGLAQSKMWPLGTLCITIAANIADSGVLGFDACFPDSVVGFIPSEPIPSVRYFEYFMRTAKEHLEKFAPSTAQKNINLGILEQVWIPIPPIAEQRRIVAKVDQLMALVDRLEAQLAASNTAAINLIEAVVAELTVQG